MGAAAVCVDAARGRLRCASRSPAALAERLLEVAADELGAGGRAWRRARPRVAGVAPRVRVAGARASSRRSSARARSAPRSSRCSTAASREHQPGDRGRRRAPRRRRVARRARATGAADQRASAAARDDVRRGGARARTAAARTAGAAGEPRRARCRSSRSDTRELLGSLFGDVPGLDAAAGWLHELSQGSPQTLHAVRAVPRRSRDRALRRRAMALAGEPARAGAAADARRDARGTRWPRSSDDARALALGLALARDESRVGLAAGDPRAARGLSASCSTRRRRTARAHLRARSTSCCAQAWCSSATSTTCSRSARWSMRCCARPTRPRASARTCAWPMSSTTATSAASAASASCSARAKSGARSSCSSRPRTSASAAVAWIGAECASRSSPSARCVALEHWQAHAGTPREGIVLRRMLAADVLGLRLGSDRSRRRPARAAVPRQRAWRASPRPTRASPMCSA